MPSNSFSNSSSSFDFSLTLTPDSPKFFVSAVEVFRSSTDFVALPPLIDLPPALDPDEAPEELEFLPLPPLALASALALLA